MRCICRATSLSMPGRMRSRNSTTVTSVPSRRQTEPSSSPITPAPTTIIFFGTLGRLSALVDDLAGRGDAALALDPVDLVLLEQEGDAVDVGGDGIVLVLHQRRVIEFRRVQDDAERSHAVSGFLEHLGGVKQRLRGNAADVE